MLPLPTPHPIQPLENATVRSTESILFQYKGLYSQNPFSKNTTEHLMQNLVVISLIIFTYTISFYISFSLFKFLSEVIIIFQNKVLISIEITRNYRRPKCCLLTALPIRMAIFLGTM